MARRRRSTQSAAAKLVTRQLTRRMPPTLRFALENRTHGTLMLILAAALIGSGIISIQWQSGQPDVQLHTDRARQVGSQVVHWAENLGEKGAQPGARTDEHAASDFAQPLGEVIEQYGPGSPVTVERPGTYPAGSTWR